MLFGLLTIRPLDLLISERIVLLSDCSTIDGWSLVDA